MSDALRRSRPSWLGEGWSPTDVLPLPTRGFAWYVSLKWTQNCCLPGALFRIDPSASVPGTRLTWRNFHARLSNRAIDMLEYTRLATHRGTGQDMISTHSPQLDPELDPQLGVGRFGC